MARGKGNLSAWDHQISVLRICKSSFRMVKRKGRDWIYIRQYKDKKVVQEFSTKCFRWFIDADVNACADACMDAHRAGRWLHVAEKDDSERGLTWQVMAESALINLRLRVAREGSRKNAEGHLRELSEKKGRATVEGLKAWALERDPVAQSSAFRNRIETISHINKAGDLRLDELLVELKAMRPTGAKKKEQERATQKIKAIPTEEALEAWLDDMEGFTQWTLAMIATYGLRPSEAWHVVSIDEDGWVHVPGDGLTKTDEHFAPAQPAAWVERYQLRENFEKYQAELNERWPINWEERNGLRIPTNNSVVSNALYHELYKNRIARLWVDEEWVRPYDLRHSYAIRCETSADPELAATPSEEFAKWLGHGLDVHKRVYLAFMSSDRRKAGLKARIGKSQESPAEEAGLSEEILAKLKKLEMLEKLMNS